MEHKGSNEQRSPTLLDFLLRERGWTQRRTKASGMLGIFCFLISVPATRVFSLFVKCHPVGHLLFMLCSASILQFSKKFTEKAADLQLWAF